jgi:predicted enzyme related to lactoylglutathione lyase
MNPVIHFELPALNGKRMADFYSGVFGWKAQFLGEEMGNYITVSTTETDEKGRPKDAGAINGGLYPVKDDGQQYHPSLVIGVGDIKECIQRINNAGGKVIGEPVQIPGIGTYVSFTDTEGNTLSVLQPLME